MSIYLKIPRVGRNENLFIFSQNGNKNCRVGTKKSGSVGLAETQLFFFRPYFFHLCAASKYKKDHQTKWKLKK